MLSDKVRVTAECVKQIQTSANCSEQYDVQH